MKLLHFFFIITLGLLLASCGSSDVRFRNKSSDYQPIYQGDIQQVSKIADYTVKPQKVSGTYTGAYEKQRSNQSISLAKELAVGDAITSAQCDFLLNPIYDVQVDGKNITVNVMGYPAEYTSFKTQTTADSLQIVTQEYAVVPSTTQSMVSPAKTKEKKGRGKKVLKILGVTYLAGALITLAVASSY